MGADKLVDAVTYRLADEHGVRRGATEKIGAEILQNLYLALGIAGGDRNGRGPHVLRPVVQSQSAGEQAIAVGHVDEVVPRRTGGRQGPGRPLCPHLDVVLGIAHHRLLARGAGGGVDAHQLPGRHREQAVGIIVPQVGLDGKGQLADVVDGMDVPGLQAHLVEFPAVEGDVLIGIVYHPDQARGLQGMEIVPGRALDFRLKNRHGFRLLPVKIILSVY